MASSKVVRVRPESLPRNTSCSVDLSDSSGDEDTAERDQGLDDFDIIKTIGKCQKMNPDSRTGSRYLRRLIGKHQ